MRGCSRVAGVNFSPSWCSRQAPLILSEFRPRPPARDGKLADDVVGADLNDRQIEARSETLQHRGQSAQHVSSRIIRSTGVHYRGGRSCDPSPVDCRVILTSPPSGDAVESGVGGPGGAASTAAAGRLARTRCQSKSGCPTFAVLRKLPCHGQTDFLSRVIWFAVLPLLAACPSSLCADFLFRHQKRSDTDSSAVDEAGFQLRRQLMLKLSLDELFGPDIVAAFQAQWTSEHDAAAAQAAAAVRAIVKPQGAREEFLSRLIRALVGPEPDGLAWMEALAKGSFNLRDNVTYAIGRVGESPAKFIDRQRQRIHELSEHPKAKGRRADYENAYNDALRLVVATSLLTQLRTGVAAKAAIGAGWPLMAAVKTHLSEDEKRALFWFGNNAELQANLANSARTTLAAFRAANPDVTVPRKAEYDRTLPHGADINAFFEPKQATAFSTQLGRKARRAMPVQVPDFIKDSSSLNDADQAWARFKARMLLGLSEATSGVYAFAMAMRSERRYMFRQRWLDGETDIMPENFHVQAAIWDHVQYGGFLPPATPIEYIHYVEEDACHAFHMHGKNWIGFDEWKDAGFFKFEHSLTRLTSLDF